MAWRIHDSVIRGELDNRTKGIVRGRLWLHALAEPITLELAGNAHADLAGCLLRFQNPVSTNPLRPDATFAALQRGTVGDLTASRKVRVFDIPFEQAYDLIKRGEKPPEHWANCLYLEWFSSASGRVVIEGVDWRLDISPAEWRLTAEDEQQRRRDAENGWAGFAQQLDEAVEAHRHESPENLQDWDEFDWEKSLRESDARTNKYAELLDKYGDSPNADELIAKEMGWDQDPDAVDGPEDRIWDVDEFNRICQESTGAPAPPDPLTEGVDWIRTAEGDIRHPLQDRCFRSALELWRECKARGLTKSDDPDLWQLLNEFQITGAKLAGALNGLAQGRGVNEAGLIVASLKRALAHLHAAQSGLQKLATKPLLQASTLGRTRKELFEIREGILALMKRFRAAD
jgi:hypothetical protein